VGVGEGEGFNVNVGWIRKGMGDAEYLAVWEQLLMPMARDFQPELVLVSSGFDAAVGDMGKFLDMDVSFV
jgi:histone deacetylase 6